MNNSTNILEIKDLHVEIAEEEKEIISGLSLTIKSGEIHAIMGPNGSGKSTLCKALMGHPKYEITSGSATLNGEDILEMEADERANLGLFLAFQHPMEIPGVTLSNFLRHAKNAGIKYHDPNGTPIAPREFLDEIKSTMANLKMPMKFAGRSVNEGFSGGEKKRAEIVQMSILKPKIAMLDEIDSGLDIDALKTAAEGINKVFEHNNTGILLITHYQRILNYVKPHFVHIMHDGKIIKSGDAKLAHELEESGYDQYINQ